MSIQLNKLTDEQLDKIDSLIQKENRLTNWKKEPSINDLKYDLLEAKSHQSKYIQNILKWEELYDAPKWGKEKHKGSRVNPKLIRKQAEWTCPSLSEPFLSTSELFDVKPLTFEDVERAKQTSLILNNQFNTKLNKTKLVDKVVRELVKRGTCIVRTGWDYQEKEVIEEIEQFKYTPVPSLGIPPEIAEQQGIIDPSQELQAQYKQLAILKKENPDSYEQSPSELKAGFEMSAQSEKLLRAVSIGFTKEKRVKPVCNKPTVDVCDIKNVYIDPTCKDDLDKAQFIIHQFEMGLSDLKASGLYKNIDKLYHQFINDSFDYNNESAFKFKDKARRKVVVNEYWGYWDIDGNGLTKSIVVSWVGDVIIRMEENPFPDGKPPFVIFNFLPEDNSVYGIANAELLEDNQKILGATTRGVIDLIGQSANAQTGFAKNFLDATNKVKFKNGQDYEYNQGFDPRVHVYTHKYPEIPNSAMNIIAMMNNEAESLSGVKAFSGTGISASNLGDVAVGIRGVLDAVSKREMSILRRISDGFIKLGRKIMSMNSEFLSEQEVVRVTNREFIKVRRDDLLSNYDLALTISTAEADDAKAKEIAFMLQTIGSSQGQELNQMMLAEIFELRKMPDLAEQVRNYNPEPDPIEQEMRQLEVEHKKAEIELMKAEAQERMAKSQVQEAKVNTEVAKADSLQSDVDNKAIDFMERSHGVKHQHELDKQAMVNQGILDKERLKAESALDRDTQKSLNDLTNQIALNEITPQKHYQQLGINQ